MASKDDDGLLENNIVSIPDHDINETTNDMSKSNVDEEKQEDVSTMNVQDSESTSNHNQKKENDEPNEAMRNSDEDVPELVDVKRRKSCSSDEEDDEDNLYRYDPTPNTSYPRPKWHSINQLQQREYGNLLKPGCKRPFVHAFNSHSFRQYAYNSLYFFQRFELMGKLEEHNGCVNCLNFDTTSQFICSGSDDLKIAIWDWKKSKLKHSYHSGHVSNVFQAKWCCDNTHIVTCARDGKVLLCDLNRSTIVPTKLAQHRGPAHKLTMTGQPQVILSCGEDAIINEIDFRTDKPNKLILVKNDKDRKVALYSIHSNITHNPIQFVVSGRDPIARVYDRRYISDSDSSPLLSLCPPKLIQSRHTVTCAQYSPSSDAILTSYNDDDLYTFNSKSGQVENFYQGHRNNATVKGCAWFGNSFVMSGSDDGYIYGWDRTSQHIVMSLYADESGVVNCLEPHPTAPILATSGLDDTVKVWVPSANQWPQTLKGIKQRICTNMRDRKLEHKRYGTLDDGDDIDASMLFLIIRHMRRQRARSVRLRREANQRGNNVVHNDDDDDDEDFGNDFGDDDEEHELGDEESDDSDNDGNSMHQQCIQS